jgi:hypothetical protein
MITDNVTRISKGLFRDSNVLDQPKGTYRYALNTVLETREGDVQIISNEEGNQAYAITNQGTTEMHIIGSVYIGDNEHILFIVGNSVSIIALLKEGNIESPLVTNDNVEFLVIDSEDVLAFSEFSQIQAEYKLRRGCEKWIYFTDETNKIRSFNCSDPESFKTNPNGDPPEGKTVWSKVKFELQKGYNKRPEFLSVEILSGGELKSGTYNFAIQYVDENKNPTEWITTSMPVSIYKDGTSGSYDGVIGSSNPPVGETTPLFGQPPTSKSIKLILGNLDDSYSHYRIAIIEATAGSGSPNRALMSQPFFITDTEFIYDGNPLAFTVIDLNEILVAKADLGIPKHVCQAEDVLLVANINNTSKDVCSLQQYASKITSNYVTKFVFAYDYKEKGNPKTPDTLWDTMTAIGGEVYAHGIVYVFDDDTESPAYHIPGRNAHDRNGNPIQSVEAIPLAEWDNHEGDIKAITGSDANAIVEGGNIQKWRVYDTSDDDGKMSFWQAQNAEYPIRENCNGDDYWGVDADGFGLTGKKIRHHRFPSRNKIAHVITAPNDPLNPNVGTYLRIILDSIKQPKNVDPIDKELYYRLTFNIIFTDGSTETRSESGFFTSLDFEYIANKIWNINYFEEGKDIESIDNIVLEGSLRDNSDIVYANDVELESPGGDLVTTEITWMVQSKSTLEGREDSEVIQLIGIKFDNIEIPEGCKGYYFVRAERDTFNRTILDKGYSGSLRQNDEYIAFTNITETVYEGKIMNDHGEIYDHNTRVKYLFSPLSLFRNRTINPVYITVERIFHKIQGSNPVGTKTVKNIDDEKGGIFDNDGFDWKGAFIVDSFITDGQPVAEHNYRVLQTKTLPPVNKDIGFTTNDEVKKVLYNCSFDNRVQFLELDRDFEFVEPKLMISNVPLVADHPFQDVYYVSLKVERDVHPDIDNIKYYKMHNNMLTYDSTEDDTGGVEIYGYDGFISHFPITTSMFQGVAGKVRILDFIVYAIIIIASAVVTFFTAGGGTPVLIAAIALAVAGLTVAAFQTFASDFANKPEFRKLMRSIMMTKSVMGDLNDDRYEAVMERATGLFVESEVNIGLRENVNYGCSGFLKSDQEAAVENYMVDKFTYYETGSDTSRLKLIPCPEVYVSNLDFQRTNKEKVFFALASSYDCCSDCRENFPNRIHYSQKAFSEEQIDSFSRFLPLDYIDIPGEYGEITDIFMEKSSLYVRTEGALWLLPQNVHERVQGDVVSLIGTGGFFAITPKKLFDTKTGAGGGYQKFATIKTPFGSVFVDETQGTLYLLNFSAQTGTQIEELTALKYGMSKWTKQNFKILLSEQIRKTLKEKFEHSYKPASKYGIGIHTAYDNEYKRLIVTKIDYIIKQEIIDEDKLISFDQEPYALYGWNRILIGDYDESLVGVLGFNIYNNTFWKYTEDYIHGSHVIMADLIEFDDTDYFEDKSFTISFSFSTMSWVSWHSYKPRKYIFDNNNLYSALVTKAFAYNPGDDYFYTAKLFKHNIAGQYHKYYDQNYAFIVEYIVLKEPILDAIFDNIMIQTVAKKDDVEQRFVTFNKALFYNHRQLSGLLNLIIVDETMDTDYLQQYVVNLPDSIIVKRKNKNWTINDFRDIRVNYSLPLFIGDLCGDVNTDSIDTQKDWTELEPFMDKFLGVRLILDNKNDVKLLLNYMLESIKPVIG